MVNPLGSPGSPSSCLLGFGERWLPPMCMDLSFWYGQELSAPWYRDLGGPLLHCHPLAKGWLSPALVPPAPTQFPCWGCFPRGSDAHCLLAMPMLCQPRAWAGQGWAGPCQPPRAEL